MSVQSMLTLAASQVGYREGYGNNTKYGAWYGMNGAAWCDMFVSWVGNYSGNRAAIGKFALTRSHASWYMSQGRWGHTPRVGALVFFRFYGSYIHHVGIVEKILPGGYIQTIEGNTNAMGSRTGGGVWRKQRSSYGIVGYGYPAYPASAPSAPAYPGVLREGARGSFVVLIQRKIGTSADGVWGPLTTAALKRWQSLHHLSADGVFGPLTYKAMFL